MGLLTYSAPCWQARWRTHPSSVNLSPPHWGTHGMVGKLGRDSNRI